ncbi:hypothetical protein [Caldimonas brevitalea]|uniref:Uncharacterized protein n=1 Tax=Caldimonas brevitalea TaxID=413882 RepID=A0A0G3BLH7_9BURK|nr:hypothetical protein [Caldimonas brevitalea]AKJ28823.1 hypothetical protein AAW51_2132 [Caldimonas brevitalea]
MANTFRKPGDPLPPAGEPRYATGGPVAGGRRWLHGEHGEQRMPPLSYEAVQRMLARHAVPNGRVKVEVVLPPPPALQICTGPNKPPRTPSEAQTNARQNAETVRSVASRMAEQGSTVHFSDQALQWLRQHAKLLPNLLDLPSLPPAGKKTPSPNAKPAISGLTTVQEGRFRGAGFCDGA